MLARIRDRLTYANVMATIAVFIALGGSGYAATKINGKNLKNSSVSGKKLKNRTITRGKVKRNTLTGGEIAESKLGQVPSAASADNASHADDATHAGSADTAGNANLIDGLDSSDLARRSDGVGFRVATSGWTTSALGFTRDPEIGQVAFRDDGTSDNGVRMSLPLAYPTKSNGRPLLISSIRICRSVNAGSLITAYGISVGSGDSFANDTRTVSVSKTSFGCDVLDVASVNSGEPFDATGNLTAEFVVIANFASNGQVALGAPELTLVPAG